MTMGQNTEKKSYKFLTYQPSQSLPLEFADDHYRHGDVQLIILLIINNAQHFCDRAQFVLEHFSLVIKSDNNRQKQEAVIVADVAGTVRRF